MHGTVLLYLLHDLGQLFLLLGKQVRFHCVFRLLEDRLDFRLMPFAHLGESLNLCIHDLLNFDLLGLCEFELAGKMAHHHLALDLGPVLHGLRKPIPVGQTTAGQTDDQTEQKTSTIT